MQEDRVIPVSGSATTLPSQMKGTAMEEQENVSNSRAYNSGIEPLRCKLGFHKWSVWSERYFRFLIEKQDRKCKKCRIIDQRILREME